MRELWACNVSVNLWGCRVCLPHPNTDTCAWRVRVSVGTGRELCGSGEWHGWRMELLGAWSVLPFKEHRRTAA